MLNDKDRIFKNLYNDSGTDFDSAKNRKNTAPEKGKTTLLEVKNA